MKTSNKNWWTGLFQTIDSIPPVVFIFGVLCINFLSFVSFNNEEHYLLYAQMNFHSNWIPDSFFTPESSGNRLLFEKIFGWVINSFGFETTVFLGRLLNFFLLAIPLASLFKLLKFSNIWAFLVLQIFIVADQSFYAGEWIFGSLESKTFAYIFVFWGLVEILKNRWYRAVVLMVVATYFHILIGGWFAISCFGMLLLSNLYPVFSFKKITQELPKLVFLYTIPLIPLLYYLATNLLINAPKVVDGVNLDHIYVYFRNKHHIGLFYTFDYFFKKHAWKVAISVIAFLLFFKKSYTAKEAFFATLKNLMLVMLGIGFFFLGVSLLDKLFFDLSGGFLLKSYPFRMQSMAFLIFIILVLHQWQKVAVRNLQWQKTLAFAAIAGFGLLFFKGGKNVQKMLTYQSNEPYNEVIDFIKQETEPTDAIMIVENKGGFVKSGGRNNQFGLDLLRRTRRDNFVHFKFVPVSFWKLYEWYKRLQVVEKVEESPDYIHQVRKNYKVDYVLTPQGFEMPLEVVFENEGYRLYR